jgi:transposase
MSAVSKATPIILTEAERAELGGLARSTKSEHRLRQRARIVLLAAAGMATRVIARDIGCTIGAASKWRVRYAADRLAGLDETGERGAAPKYTAETGRRILAVFDGLPPAGCGRWTAPLIAQALGDVHEQYVWRLLHVGRIYSETSDDVNTKEMRFIGDRAVPDLRTRFTPVPDVGQPAGGGTK